MTSISNLFFFSLADAFDYLDAPLTRVAGADVPTPYAKNLEDYAFPDTPIITKVIRDTLNKKIGA